MKADRPALRVRHDAPEGATWKAQKAAVAVAKTKVDERREKAEAACRRRSQIAKLAVAVAEAKKKPAGEPLQPGRERPRRRSTRRRTTPRRRGPKRLKDDPKLYKANVDYTTADERAVAEEGETRGAGSSESASLRRGGRGRGEAGRGRGEQGPDRDRPLHGDGQDRRHHRAGHHRRGQHARRRHARAGAVARSRPGRGSSAPRSRPTSPTASARTSKARRSRSSTTPTRG